MDMAVVLEDRVRLQATIRNAIRDAVSLEGFGDDEAYNITAMMGNPAFPVELEVINQQFIRSTTGENTLR
jgi:preprotein translocase subunit SecD